MLSYSQTADTGPTGCSNFGFLFTAKRVDTTICMISGRKVCVEIPLGTACSVRHFVFSFNHRLVLGICLWLNHVRILLTSQYIKILSPYSILSWYLSQNNTWINEWMNERNYYKNDTQNIFLSFLLSSSSVVGNSMKLIVPISHFTKLSTEFTFSGYFDYKVNCEGHIWCSKELQTSPLHALSVRCPLNACRWKPEVCKMHINRSVCSKPEHESDVRSCPK
jgi:hypothetical protein